MRKLQAHGTHELRSHKSLVQICKCARIPAGRAKISPRREEGWHSRDPRLAGRTLSGATIAVERCKLCKFEVTCAEDSCYELGMACGSRATEFVEACGQGFAVRNERLS